MYRFTLTAVFGFYRQNGVGYTAVVARLGVSISPLVMLLEDMWYLLPAVTYCTVAVASGLVTSLLPETLNTRLPESIEDIEKPKQRGNTSKEDCRYFGNLVLKLQQTSVHFTTQSYSIHYTACAIFPQIIYILLCKIKVICLLVCLQLSMHDKTSNFTFVCVAGNSQHGRWNKNRAGREVHSICVVQFIWCYDLMYF